MASRRKQKDARRQERQEGKEGQMRTATRLLVATGRQSGHDAAQIRADVTRAIQEALGVGVLETRSIVVDIRPESLVDNSGVFRLVIENEGIDRIDSRTRERWFAVVRDELERALNQVG